MRMNEDEIDLLKINRVFYAANNPYWNNLYVEFADPSSVSTCYRFTRNLQAGRKIFPYIPKMFYNRYKALDKHAYNLRHSSQHYKTRIRFGTNDIILLKCLPGQNDWSYTSHVNLPPAEIPAASSRVSFSSSQSSGYHSSDRFADRKIE